MKKSLTHVKDKRWHAKFQIKALSLVRKGVREEGRKGGTFPAMSLCCAVLCEALSTAATSNVFKAFSLFRRKKTAYDGIALHCIALKLYRTIKIRKKLIGAI